MGSGEGKPVVKKEESSTPTERGYWFTILTWLLTILLVIAFVSTCYNYWYFATSTSKKLAYWRFFLLIALFSSFIRNPEIPEKNASFFWLLLFTLLGTIFFYSFSDMRKIFVNNKEEIKEFLKRKDVEIPNWLKISEKDAQQLKNTIDIGPKLIDELKNEQRKLRASQEEVASLTEFLRLELSARNGNADSFAKLGELSQIASHPFQKEALSVVEQIFESHSLPESPFGVFPIIFWDAIGYASGTENRISLNEIKELYAKYSGSLMMRLALIHFLANIRNQGKKGEDAIPELEQNKWFLEILQQDKNLFVQEKIGRILLKRFPKDRVRPLAIDSIISNVTEQIKKQENDQKESQIASQPANPNIQPNNNASPASPLQ